MKKFIAVMMIAAAMSACKGGSNANAGSDSATINTTNTSGNDAATMSQQIPTDSVETTKDSTGNIRPGDTTKGKNKTNFTTRIIIE